MTTASAAVVAAALIVAAVWRADFLIFAILSSVFRGTPTHSSTCPRLTQRSAAVKPALARLGCSDDINEVPVTASCLLTVSYQVWPDHPVSAGNTGEQTFDSQRAEPHDHSTCCGS
jgi:hypothetical protein